MLRNDCRSHVLRMTSRCWIENLTALDNHDNHFHHHLADWAKGLVLTEMLI